MPLFHSQEDFDAHQDELFNDSLSEGAFKQEQVFQYTSLHGQECQDQEWILSPFDTWERNPHFTGKPGRHPEDNPGEDDAE